MVYINKDCCNVTSTSASKVYSTDVYVRIESLFCFCSSTSSNSSTSFISTHVSTVITTESYDIR